MGAYGTRLRCECGHCNTCWNRAKARRKARVARGLPPVGREPVPFEEWSKQRLETIRRRGLAIWTADPVSQLG